ncbi:MAG TPA: NAD-dependent epimerase/dehydratase family protein [Candidatus Limnocylindria bacterium]|nr:NAD-dependent epimerase/dehydratase family protein [Candidatus Limnocylindria bacterium]
MRVLVTGAAGFIGSHLVLALLERGDEVSAIDNLFSGDAHRLAPWLDRIRFVEGDVRDPSALDRAAAGCDAILHQAAIASVAASVRDPIGNDAVNSGGTIQVMLAAARNGCRRVVLAGSSAVYGSSTEPPGRETQVPDPQSPYAASKLAAESYLHAMSPLLGVETVALRYFNVFGPGQDPMSEYAAAVPRFVTGALRGQVLTIYGDGRQSRDFTYVTNVVAANLLALDAPGVDGLTCNVGTGSSVTLLELVGAIEAAVGRPVTVQHEAPRAGDVRDSRAAIDLAVARLGYRVQVAFAEGIRETVSWYRSQEPVGRASGS